MPATDQDLIELRQICIALSEMTDEELDGDPAEHLRCRADAIWYAMTGQQHEEFLANFPDCGGRV